MKGKKSKQSINQPEWLSEWKGSEEKNKKNIFFFFFVG